MTQIPTGDAAHVERDVYVRTFTQRFSSTPLGARLARHLALHQLAYWDIPYGTGLADRAAAVVAELAANAVTHGRVPGRDFELALTLTARTLRIDVSDTRADRRPPEPGEAAPPQPPEPLADSGRGLPLVTALASRWHVLPRRTGPGKTVTAELDLPQRR